LTPLMPLVGRLGGAPALDGASAAVAQIVQRWPWQTSSVNHWPPVAVEYTWRRSVPTWIAPLRVGLNPSMFPIRCQMGRPLIAVR